MHQRQGGTRTTLWGSFSATMTHLEATEILEHGDLDNPRLVPSGSNYTFLVDVCRDGQAVCQAIYKPRRGEIPLWDFPEGTLYRREYAAYLLSQALGWAFVPPTVIRDGPYGEGVVLLYIPHDGRIHFFSMGAEHTPDLQRICTFDLVVNNADRKATHCVVGPDGRVWGIDHGLTFHVHPKLRTVIWEYQGQPIPQHLLQDCQRLLDDLAHVRGVGPALGELISPAEYQALQGRLHRLLERPVFPEPSHRHATPWPWL